MGHPGGLNVSDTGCVIPMFPAGVQLGNLRCKVISLSHPHFLSSLNCTLSNKDNNAHKNTKIRVYYRVSSSERLYISIVELSVTC